MAIGAAIVAAVVWVRYERGKLLAAAAASQPAVSTYADDDLAQETPPGYRRWGDDVDEPYFSGFIPLPGTVPMQPPLDMQDEQDTDYDEWVAEEKRRQDEDWYRQQDDYYDPLSLNPFSFWRCHDNDND